MTCCRCLNVKPVYGAQHPPLMQPAASPTKNVSGTKTAQARQKKQSSFDAFRNRTNDAWEEPDPWDVGEPDDVELSDSEEVKLSPQSRHPVLTGLVGVSDEARERVGSGRAAQLGDKQERSGSGRGSGSQHSGTGTKELKKLVWGGIPVTVRPTTWKLLSGYFLSNVEWRQSTLERKRKEYERFVSR
ncbi:TBC1 domain family member 22B-like [Corticium candelabrum]|uniref:TBC1 domain family member 22B-like n=1 Tax=Corticium candelabrum TaxID=121492 RepID=UPI002E275421|nr:TBC1 domain family member 22B-like [Corticium candelabrum]